MKKRLIQIFCIVFILLYFNPTIVHGSFKEIWKRNFESRINKLFSVDMNKNGIKEILILSGGKKLKLIEWDKNTFVIKWRPPEFKAGVDFEYYDFSESLWIKEFNPAYSQEYDRLFKCRMSLLRSFPPKLDKPEEFGKYDAFLKALEKEKCGEIDPKIKPAYFRTLLYKDGKYLLKEVIESPIPSWPDEIYRTSGSFKARGAKDVIITFSDTGSPLDVYLTIREANAPNRLLWVSTFEIDKQLGVQIFGDFDGDRKIELLLITGGTKNYWINREGDKFRVKVIKRYVKNEAQPLFLLNPINQKFLKAGRTVSKDFDELFFIDALYYGGPIYKATWKKDKFDVQGIVSPKNFEKDKGETGFENLNLADIDNDGFDEIIISGVRGDLVETEEEPYMKNRRDVIHILKWNGKEYKKIWTSKSLGAITQILVDDVTGDGKKEIVVGNDKGEIHICGQN